MRPALAAACRSRLTRVFIVGYVLLLVALVARPAAASLVSIPAGALILTAELLTPAGPGPFPVVVALHGCGGLYSRNGERLNSRHQDWADRLVAAGYAVLLPDSFKARGVTQICTLLDRPVTPKDRADDTRAALAWIAQQPSLDPKRAVLLGWSHGAMTLLWTLRPGFLDAGVKPVQAFAFYPGCREIARLTDWKPSLPLTMLVGAADDWTKPAPCLELAARAGFRIVEYADAYHDFDAPNMPIRVRKGLSGLKSGEAHVGTNPIARASAIAEVMGALQRP